MSVIGFLSSILLTENRFLCRTLGMNRMKCHFLAALLALLGGAVAVQAQTAPAGDAKPPVAGAKGEPSGEDLNVPGLTDDITLIKKDEPVVTIDDTSLLGLIAKGGWTMWILGAFSLGVIGLAIYGFIDLRPQNFHPEVLSRELLSRMEHGDFAGVVERVQQDESTLGHMTSAMAAHIAEVGYSTEDNEFLKGLMAEAGVRHNRFRVRLVNYFSVLAQAAPMVGLLGTVSGMIKAFGQLGKSGMGDPSQLANHIAEALITTASGLIIALPAIFFYFFFRDRLEELVATCEDRGASMLVRLRRAAYSVADEVSTEPGSEDVPVPA